MAEKKQRPGGSRKDEVVTREYTINLHKRLHGWILCCNVRERCGRRLADMWDQPHTAVAGRYGRGAVPLCLHAHFLSVGLYIDVMPVCCKHPLTL
ncbi:60S ribosomal protein L31 [Zea mays]|uniref:60S ribosomal protein L31 n=1 Tax=Zea mays TaxID=4577 RepID=A0A1D6NZP9_MAIZE|nr:60S ribosomal protein L31 [Zea mays]